MRRCEEFCVEWIGAMNAHVRRISHRMDRGDGCAGVKNFAALRIAAAATKRRHEECRDLNIPLTSILMRWRRWREECHDFDMSSCSAASSERANREIGDGGAATMRCTG